MTCTVRTIGHIIQQKGDYMAKAKAKGKPAPKKAGKPYPKKAK